MVISKLLLSKNGYTDKVEVEQTGSSEEAKTDLIKKVSSRVDSMTTQEL